MNTNSNSPHNSPVEVRVGRAVEFIRCSLHRDNVAQEAIVQTVLGPSDPIGDLTDLIDLLGDVAGIAQSLALKAFDNDVAKADAELEQYGLWMLDGSPADRIPNRKRKRDDDDARDSSA